MTDLDIYEPPAGQLEQYQAALAMTPAAAKALDDQLRAATRAILREDTDYGIIPGTGGQKSLWRPGAQKLLQWFGLGFTCDRVEIDLDGEGRREGVTYRCTITKRLGDGRTVPLATCEGYAGYDEDKFYQSAEARQFKAEANERMWAKKDRRVANPEKWQNLGEYRAPWNAVIKRSQKRAIVGATIDATAAGGLFGQDEEDDSPAPADGAAAWYELALKEALTFPDEEAGRVLYVEAAHAARDGLCTPKQATHVQNRIEQRADLLKKARPVDVEDLGRQAQEAGPDPTTSGASSSADDPGSASPQETAAPSPSSPGGSASTPGDDRHRKLIGAVQGHFKRLGFGDDDRAERLWAAGKLARVKDLESLNDLDPDELAAAADALARCKDRAQLEARLAGAVATEGGTGA